MPRLAPVTSATRPLSDILWFLPVWIEFQAKRNYSVGASVRAGCRLGRHCDHSGEPMKYRKLGASDLQVSEISLGSWLTYGVGVERDKAERCVERAFELGINFIDTANVYGR